jgi:hypothetical protein
VCFYAYKRINHFREILAQFQAKETTQIPEEVITNIQNQIRKERITLHQLTNKRAKEILKKLGYNKYYEHITFIKDKLGIKPPVMSAELEQQLCNLFMDIQAPYAKHCPRSRVNFLNYYYTIFKLCEMLGRVEFLQYFPMLKDKEKRIEQDEIWRKICGELGLTQMMISLKGLLKMLDLVIRVRWEKVFKISHNGLAVGAVRLLTTKI